MLLHTGAGTTLNGATVRKFVDLSGKRFNRLVVLSPAGRDSSNSYVFLCRCECGTEVVKRASHIISGEVKSCGCFRREDSRNKIISIATKHGHCAKGASPTYKSWLAMMQRCYRKSHPHYAKYGGRGITVCEDWKSFVGFMSSMGERPLGKTLDRIDANGNYHTWNCRWATPKQQSRNTRTNHLLHFNGQTKTLAEWSELSGIGVTTIRERLRRGWEVERALCTAAK